jgi:DNA-binding NarL/FixJ family response regulator
MPTADDAGDVRLVRLLVADHAATRRGVAIALAGTVDICGEVDNAEQAIRAAKELQPDVCLIGHGLADYSPEVVLGVCRAAPETGVIVLSDQPDVEDMLEAIRSGAVGYVPGGVSFDRLRTIINAVVANEAVVPRAMVRELILELRTVGRQGDGLTRREAQVLGMLRRGQSTALIASRLQIAPVTVRRHITEVARKLGVADRSDLVGG